ECDDADLEADAAIADDRAGEQYGGQYNAERGVKREGIEQETAPRPEPGTMVGATEQLHLVPAHAKGVEAKRAGDQIDEVGQRPEHDAVLAKIWRQYGRHDRDAEQDQKWQPAE